MNKYKLNYFWIFIVISTLALILYVNRYSYRFISNEYIALLDHFVAGFIVPLWGFMLYLGCGSFFRPNRKVIYSKNAFLISLGAFLLVAILWEFIYQGFKDPDQIIADIMGLFLSWVYFIKFRKTKMEKNE